MLTDTQRAIIKATVPLLETHGEAITTHFYHAMFSEYPEVKSLFNQAHQIRGDQPRALANSVLLYARHIDNLAELGDLPAQIINKHVALQVQPAQYKIVGSCLLAAIKAVLGSTVVTAEVTQAWAAAYQQLADMLINAEEQIYAAHAASPGGWRGVRLFRVARKVAESTEITSFHLQPVDDAQVIIYRPGQYLGLRLVIDGQEHRRNYSLSAAPDGKSLRISVKREPGGLVSNYLHDCIQAEAILEIFPPAGHFTLQPGTKPIVMISAGVGITPLIAMLPQALASGRPIHFIHCARNRAVHAFREAVDELTLQHPQLKRFYCYQQAEPSDAADAVGLLSSAHLAQCLPASSDVDAYFLGPKPFMAMVKRNLKVLGVPEEQTHFEFFGPAATLN